MKRVFLSPADYHRIKFNPAMLPDLANAGPVSASILSKVRTPLEFLLGDGDASFSYMEWGSLVDCMWTTPELFESSYIVLPKDAPAKPTTAMLDAKKPSEASLVRQKWWADFEEKIAGRDVVTHELWTEAKAAVRMLQLNPLSEQLWCASERQVALLGDNPVMPGTQAKSLLDLLPMEGEYSSAVVDLKTTNDVTPYARKQIVWKFDYVVKLAFYGLLAEAAGFGARPRGIIIWQKSSYPSQVHCEEISKRSMEAGRAAVLKRLELLRQLNPNELHRHYDDKLNELDLDDWQLDKLMR